jgi:tripartite-type tricarboxylate transporter receptor subunit TctC
MIDRMTPDIETEEISLRRRKLSGLVLGLGAAGALPAMPAHAASAWPQERPIHMLIGYNPGGGTDTVGRLVAQQLSQKLGQNIVIENRGGAGSLIAADATVRAAPDGYTLMFSTAAPLTGAPLTIKNMSFDPFKDLVPVVFIGGGPYILVANPKLPVNTLPELVAYAKAHPGELNYGMPGTNTANFFFTELLNIDAGIKTVPVPYKGALALLNDVIGGRLDYTLDTPGTTMPMIRDGRLKPIAVLSEKRLTIAPEIPTAVEAGYPRLVGGSWYGIVAPKGTPDAIVQKIYQATKAALDSPEVVAGLAKRDVIVRGLGPEDFRKFIRAEYDKWKEVTEKIGLQPQ